MSIDKTWRQQIDALPNRKRSFVYGTLFGAIGITLIGSPFALWVLCPDPGGGNPDELDIFFQTFWPIAILLKIAMLLLLLIPSSLTCGSLAALLTRDEPPSIDN